MAAGEGCVLFLCVAAAFASGLDVVFEWKTLSFRNLGGQTFTPENNVPVGLDVWRDKLFLTVPRWKTGVPASLAYVPLSEYGKNRSPVLVPYPDWAAHNLSLNINPRFGGIEQPVRIVSPFRIRVDRCDRLWVLDTGMIDILGSLEVLGSNQLLAFDLKTDKLLHQYEIPRSFMGNKTFFANLAVDVKNGNCDHTFVYLADLGTFSMVVYSMQEARGWSIKHEYFHSDLEAMDYEVSGINFTWPDGLFGLALSAQENLSGFRTLYFHPFSSYKEFSVSTKVLQDEALWTSGRKTSTEFKLLGSRGQKSQSCASFMDEKTGVLFYTQVNKNAIGCWNSKKAYSPDTQGMVAVDEVTMVFPNDVKVDSNRTLWVLTDRLPFLMYKKLNTSDVNFRVLAAPVDQAIANTVCTAVALGSPGNAPGSPGNAPGSPGNAPGSPGNAPGSPGNAPGSPGNALVPFNIFIVIFITSIVKFHPL